MKNSADGRPGEAFARASFRPVVAILASQDVENLCRLNNLTFCDLLLPFSRLSVDVSFKDPQNQSVNHTVKDFQLDFRDLRRDGFLLNNVVLPAVLSEAVREVASSCDDAVCSIQQVKDRRNERYEIYRDVLLRWAEPSDFDYLKCYLACILVVSTAANNPLDELAKLSQAQHTQQLSYSSVQHKVTQSMPCLSEVGGPPYAAIPKWFLPNIFKYHVLMHDVSSGEDSRAESLYQSMKMTYGAHACHLLRVNSVTSEEFEATSSLPDPWQALLQDKYRGFYTGLRLAKANFASPVASPIHQPTHFSFDNAVSPQNYSTFITIGTEAADELLPAPEEEEAARLSYRSESIPHAFSAQNLERFHRKSLTFLTISADLEADDSVSAATTIVAQQDLQIPSSLSIHSQHGRQLSSSDRDRLNIFVQEFVVRGLLPFVERQMRVLSEQVAARKGISKSFTSGVRKWFGGGGGGGGTSIREVVSTASLTTAASPSAEENRFGTARTPSPNSSRTGQFYTQESGEMQQRRLADLSFLFQHYSLAFETYYSLKKDFTKEQSLPYLAAALEMAAISSYMQQNRDFPLRYMDVAVTNYMNAGCRFFATRAAVFACELAVNSSSEPASLLIRMTGTEDDLLGAVFLEQAARLFAGLGWHRKAALHLVLAGHRYGKANQRRHALFCYQMSTTGYLSKGWRFAEDHINYTMGHQIKALGYQSGQAVNCFSRLLVAKTGQEQMQQATFLRDYLSAYATDYIRTNVPLQERPDLSIPNVDSQMIAVYIAGAVQVSVVTEDLAVPNVRNKDCEWEVDEEVWQNLEKSCFGISFAESPTNFRYVVSHQNRWTENSCHVTVPVDEKYIVVVSVENPLLVEVTLTSLRLEWSSEAKSVSAVDVSEEVDVVRLAPQERRDIVLTISPCAEMMGSVLQITGLRYGISCPPVLAGAIGEEHQQAVIGRQNLFVRGRRLNGTMAERTSVVYSTDCRLSPKVAAEEMPRLQATLSSNDLEEAEYCLPGQLLERTLTLGNIGKLPIDRVSIAAHPADSVCVCSPPTQPFKLQKISGQLIWATLSTFDVGSSVSLTLTIKAKRHFDDGVEDYQVKLLIYYSHGKRWRCCRRTVRLRVRRGLAIRCSAYAAGADETAGALVQLNCRNESAGSHQLTLLRALIFNGYCDSSTRTCWYFYSHTLPAGLLKAGEFTNVCFRLKAAQRQEDRDILAKHCVLWLADSAVQHDVPETMTCDGKPTLPWLASCRLSDALPQLAVLYEIRTLNETENETGKRPFAEVWLPLPADLMRQYSAGFVVQPTSTPQPYLLLSPSDSRKSGAGERPFAPIVQLSLTPASGVVKHDFVLSRLCYVVAELRITNRESFAVVVELALSSSDDSIERDSSSPPQSQQMQNWTSSGPPTVLWTGNVVRTVHLAAGSTAVESLVGFVAGGGLFQLSSSVKAKVATSEAASSTEGTLLHIPQQYVAVVQKKEKEAVMISS